jgi:hypothetical protein
MSNLSHDKGAMIATPWRDDPTFLEHDDENDLNNVEP